MIRDMDHLKEVMMTCQPHWKVETHHLRRDWQTNLSTTYGQFLLTILGRFIYYAPYIYRLLYAIDS